jgi:glycosyltransferase involved in cell wall biosynthesis
LNKIVNPSFFEELPLELSYPLVVNFVISKDLNSKIFHDIFNRYINFNQHFLEVVISEAPIEDADIYHYHRPHLETALRKPAVVTVHHDPRDIDPWLEPKKFLPVYREASAVVCLNSLQVSDLGKVGIQNVRVIPHGFDAKIFHKRLRVFSSEKKLNIGVISKRYDRRFKGDVYMFELAERLSVDRVRFTLVGSGRAQDGARMRDLGFQVDVFEFLPYRIYGDLYHEIDFLLMVSNFEGGPANIPEALASSTPILCTNVGMASDLVESGFNGLVLSGDIREDLEMLLDLCENKGGLADRLFQGCHESDVVISWEDVIAQHIKLYCDVLTGVDI